MASFEWLLNNVFFSFILRVGRLVRVGSKAKETPKLSDPIHWEQIFGSCEIYTRVRIQGNNVKKRKR